MTPLVIQIDLDGVLADFARGFTKLRSKVCSERALEVPMLQANQTVWGECSDNDTLGNAEAWAALRKDTYFWRVLEPMVEQREFNRIAYLHQEHYVYFVTAREGRFAKYQTECWLVKRGIENPTVVMTADKAGFMRAAGVQYAIDDHPGFVDAMLKVPGANVYLMDRPYNQQYDAPGLVRVAELSAFLDVVFLAATR